MNPMVHTNGFTLIPPLAGERIGDKDFDNWCRKKKLIEGKMHGRTEDQNLAQRI